MYWSVWVLNIVYVTLVTIKHFFDLQVPTDIIKVA